MSTGPGIPALADNQRQRGPRLAPVRQALADLRSAEPGRARRALDRLAADGRLRLCTSRAELLAAVVTDWYTDRRHTPPGGRLADAPRMMAEHHRDVAALNHAARALLRADHTLHGPVVVVAGREFQTGDEVITLTQAGHTLTPAGRPRSAYVRTGSIGTVTAVHPALTVRFPGKGSVHVDRAYLTFAFGDGRDGGLAHAYALTAHKAEGATVPTARAVAAEDTSRAGLYVMLSRARHDLRGYLSPRAHLEPADDETWLPVLEPAAGPLARLADRLEHSQPERLATEHNPAAVTAHQLRARHTLAELADHDVHTGQSPAADPVIRRHAALAADAALAALALTDPPPALVARLGPRPDHGPDRRSWDHAVAALAGYHARWHPAAPPHELGPEPPPDPDDTHAGVWQQRHRHARQLADTHTGRQRRRRSQRASLHRATAGIHALLDHGWTPAALTAELAIPDQTTLDPDTLDRRVQRLLQHQHIDPTPYRQPPPPSHRQQWMRAVRLLNTAETNHLTRQPTDLLHAEHQQLSQMLADPATTPADAAAAHAQLLTLAAALDRQVDHAAAQFTQQPAGYLTNLLGRRPTNPAQAADWDRHALAVEHYRHHHLGLTYGGDADPGTTNPTRHALGPPPDQPDLRNRYQQLAAHQTTLDLDTSL